MLKPIVIVSRIQPYVIVYISVFKTNIWLGATVINNTRIFIWENGSRVGDYFENWSSNEPNNDRGNENCVRANLGKKWVDVQCHEQCSSVCEFD
jgi:hypothetical protein